MSRERAGMWMLAVLTMATAGQAQVRPMQASYIRKNTFGVFFAYSNDSSHILMGAAENRKLLNIGVTYGRRIWAGKVVNWQYHGEIQPVALESDPVIDQATTITGSNGLSGTFTSESEPYTYCVPGTAQGPPYTLNGVTYSLTTVSTCSRRWVIGEGMMPVGFEWNFIPHHKIQPFLVGHGGYMYSTHAIPIQGAGHFNFAFDFGAGVEFFRGKGRSLRVDYRYHHISNHDTAQLNPGIDNGLAQITYCFGK